MAGDIARKIVITSGKGGVGKTSLLANLGLRLALGGKSVCMVDADFGLNNLDMVTACENLVTYDVADCIEGRCRPKQALIQCKASKNAYLLPSSHTFTRTEIPSDRLNQLISGIATSFDFVLIDCPAGMSEEFKKAVCLADEALVVTTPHLSALRDADKVLASLRAMKIDKVKIVVNRVRGDLIVGGLALSPEEIEKALCTPLAGIIPDDDQVFLCNAGELPPESHAFKAFKILANNVLLGKRKIYDYSKEYLGFWGSIRRGLKQNL